jgi:hypothetical protein
MSFYIPEDGIPHSQYRGNPKSYIVGNMLGNIRLYELCDIVTSVFFAAAAMGTSHLTCNFRFDENR